MADLLQHYGSATLLWAASLGILVVYTILSFSVATFGRRARFLRSLEWAGSTKSWFPQFCWASVRNTRSMTLDAYYRFSKYHQPFILPQFGSEPWLVLPQSRMKEVYQKPDADVDIQPMLRETLAAEYTGDLDIAADPFHLDLVKHELTRKLQLLTPSVYAELVLGFQDEWKVKPNDWISIPIMPTVMKIVSRAANRVFSGTELCRNEDFLEHTRQYGYQIFTQAGLFNMIPFPSLRPIVAPFITRRSAYHKNMAIKHAAPIIEKRIQAIRAGDKDPPVDCVQWLVEKCVARNDPAELDVAKITRRLLRLNMVAIHTTTITMTTTLCSLYSSPRVDEYISGLREEVERVFKAHNGEWSKAAVNELYRIDSTIKEAMRWGDMGIFGIARIVTAPNGLDLSDGTHIPHGAKIAVPNAGIHRDPENYENPDEYDAFRFSRSRELNGHGHALDKHNQGVVITNETFLTFGYGRHSCPGRFFATQEMKLMLAHIVMNYDLRLAGPLSPRTEIKGLTMPDGKAEVLVRLRQT